MKRIVPLSLPFSLVVTLAACGGSKDAKQDACTGVTAPCVPIAAGTSESVISAAFVTAAPNSTIAFAAGTYSFTNSLNLANVAGVTIRGAGSDATDATKQTVLDFSTVVGSGEGIVADTTNQVLFLDFIARDTKGNGIKVINSDGVTWRNVKTLWSNPDGHTHGAYGLYPVQSHNVLIEGCEVAGAADAGVYVGQSDHIIVRNNDVHDNVAGIEIENSSYADVHDNQAYDNVGGILVFNMPDLALNEGGWNHVFNNQITNNNTANFARRGSSVARVPGGTGAFVLAGHDIEVDHNTFSGNNAAAFSIVSYAITGDSRLADPSSLQYGYAAKIWPARVYVHDNTFSDNGAQPKVTTPSDCPDPTATDAAADCPDPVAYELGEILGASAQYVSATGHVASLVYDGIVDPTATTSTWGGTANNPMSVCLANNGTADFLNMHFDQSGPLLLMSDPTGLGLMSTDMSTYASCTLPALPAVTVTAR
jgi:parallel beta-helix repeat protein